MHYGGRPHWGKLNFLTYEKASSLYGDHLQKFINVKRRLDPHGVFSNGFADRILSNYN
jgi:L-gulono-1,4-lactone dehydrogenase